MIKNFALFILLLSFAYSNGWTQEFDELDDIDSLLSEFPDEGEANSSEDDGSDDLQSLKDDLGEIQFDLPEDESDQEKMAKEVEDLNTNKAAVESKKKEIQNKVFTKTRSKRSNGKKAKSDLKIVDSNDNSKEAKIIFEVGKAEKELLEMAKNMQGKIPDSEWNEIAGKSTVGTYEVVKGDWLWKISKNIFGSGFYYSKVWALNPYITNPHEIEPGMILSFSTGSDNQLPSLDVAKLDKFKNKVVGVKLDKFSKWGDDTKPAWIDERERLKKEGFYLQYRTANTQEDLDAVADQVMIKEYEVYEPPKMDFAIAVPEGEYDADGFDKGARINFDFKEGININTFISSNVVQDFGKIESSYMYSGAFGIFDRIMIRFDDSIDVVVGDKFSTYAAQGEVTNKNSDRKGFKYTITGAIQAVQKHENNLWECEVIDVTGIMERGDRITVYTPKIDMLTKTFNPRLIESVLIAGFYKLQSLVSFGDIVYLDRGRADGVEVGNVFEVYGFKDRVTKTNISDNPTYKNGELSVITVTDNFSTAIVTQSTRDFIIGDVAVTKTKEAAARVAKLQAEGDMESTAMSDQALDELDVELNLDDLNDALLDKADKIQFTEDELAELERQEREKSIMSESEKDLRSLERLESDIETAEKIMREANLDEDKLLEGENLDNIEKSFNVEQQESLDELEENFGKRYLDEDLNDKENPYGLTEFDIEEIDELLNAEKDSEE